MSILLFSAMVLISCLPKDSLVKFPFPGISDIYIIKLVNLPRDTETNRVWMAYNSQSYGLFIDYWENRGYTYVNTEVDKGKDIYRYYFAKDDETINIVKVRILQFSWFI